VTVTSFKAARRGRTDYFGEFVLARFAGAPGSQTRAVISRLSSHRSHPPAPARFLLTDPNTSSTIEIPASLRSDGVTQNLHDAPFREPRTKERTLYSTNCGTVNPAFTCFSLLQSW
jgi:hypothetical protein